jgi:hypothetical protein
MAERQFLAGAALAIQAKNPKEAALTPYTPLRVLESACPSGLSVVQKYIAFWVTLYRQSPNSIRFKVKFCWAIAQTGYPY